MSFLIPTGFWRSQESSQLQALLSADFSTPKTFSKPTAAGGWIPGYAATWAWRFEEPSGASTFTDDLASKTLTLNQSGEFRNGAIAQGRWDGSSISGHGAVECFGAGGSSNIRSKLNGTGGPVLDGTAQFAVLIEFRVNQAVGTNGLAQFDSANCRFQIVGGGNGLRARGTGSTEILGVGGHEIGALHRVVFVVDQVNGVWKIFSNKGEDSGVMRSDDVSSSGDFSLFDGSTLSMAGQVESFVYFEGSQVENMTRSEALATFSHAEDPSGELQNYTRPSAITCPIGSGLLQTYSEEQIALMWKSNATRGDGFGLLDNRESENLLADGQNIEDWSTSGDHSVSSADADMGESPRGMMQARRVIDSAGSGQLTHSSISVSADTTYTLIYWLKRATGVTEDTTFDLYESGPNAEFVQNSFQLTDDDWHRVSVTFTTQATTTGITPRFHIDTSGGGEVYLWAVQLVQRDYAPPIDVVTYGSTEIAEGVTFQLDDAKIPFDVGEWNMTFSCEVDDPDKTLYLAHYAGSADYYWRTTGGQSIQALLYGDGGGGNAHNFSTSALNLSEEHDARLRFDSNGNGLPGNSSHSADMIVDGTLVNGDGLVSWDPPNSGGTFEFGYSSGVDDQIDGIISFFETYDFVREVEP